MVFEGRDLACARGGQLVFERLDFALESGDVLLLRGPNGSGKSTLLRLLAGLLPRACGRLFWRGAAIEPGEPEHHARLHFLGHANGLKPQLTVRENLTFAAALSLGAPVPPKALETFDLEGLMDTPVRYLSSGQRRRVALARLFAPWRPLWLLDEPETGLDEANRRRLLWAVEDHRRLGGLVVWATHGTFELASALVLEFGA